MRMLPREKIERTVSMRKPGILFDFLKQRCIVNVSTARGGWDIDAEYFVATIPTKSAIFAYGKMIAFMQLANKEGQKNPDLLGAALTSAREQSAAMLEVEHHLDNLLFREDLLERAKFSVVFAKLEDISREQ